MDRTTPTFNLKAVVQETGIKPDTLRAWERRYGLPEPDRSSGGHRLYSQRNIDTLRWLLTRQDEGLSISRAVKLWRQLESEGQDPLISPEYSLGESDPAASLVVGEEVIAFREKWLEACMNFNERLAEQILAQSLALFPAETVFREVLQRGIQEIGKGWYAGNVSVQQEHFASALATRKLESLLSATPPPQRSERILLAGAPQEDHVIGQLLFQLLLRRKGWETVYLGASVPLQRLEESLAVVRPQLIVLTAQQLYTAATLQTITNSLADKGIATAYAGRIFSVTPAVQTHISGYYLGDTLSGAVDRMESLVPNAPPAPKVPPHSPEYSAGLAHFRSKATPIQARVMATLERGDMQPSHSEIAELNLTRAIHAALQLGDMGLIDGEMDWVRGLLHNYGIPQEFLNRFIFAYRDAARDILGPEGKPVLDWLDDTCDPMAAEAASNA